VVHRYLAVAAVVVLQPVLVVFRPMQVMAARPTLQVLLLVGVEVPVLLV